MKKLALVLGGGAAKGYAHIGVLKTLEKNGIKPDLIVGTSMGSLIGGLYATGKSANALESLSKNFTSIGSFSLFSTLFKGNVLNVDKVKKILDKEINGFLQENTQIPFVSVATNLSKGKQTHLKSGNLITNIMASISIPGVFPKVKIGQDYFCDGGLLNNLAEDVAREIMPDAIVVSVDVIGEYSKQVEKLKFKTVENLLNASTLMTTNVIKNRPQFADLRITISQPNVSQLDFSKETGEKSIKKGEYYAKRNIEAIKKLLNGENKWRLLKLYKKEQKT